METITGKVLDGTLIIYLNGKIDSSNSTVVEDEINKIVSANEYEKMVLDAEHLEYSSSAGLRVILRLSKNNPGLRIINVSKDVYEIFSITGFTEMLNIEKAYRRLSVDGCEAIGEGANGKVYRLDPDTVIKVYRNPDSLPDIHRERELARKAFVSGIPTAIPYDVVKVGDSYGSVFELLNADSFSHLIAAEPENLDKYVKLYVELLKKIHSTEVTPGDMPDMKEVAIGWAEFMKDYLPEDQSTKLIELVKAVPDRHTMIHGDYHTKNIMMQNGEVLLIDMDTISMGHPIFELASMFLAYKGFGEIDHSIAEKFLGYSFETGLEVWNKSLALYLDTDDENLIKNVEEKSMVVGYTRLMRRTIRRKGFDSESGKAIIEMCSRHLADLLGRIDTLEF